MKIESEELEALKASISTLPDGCGQRVKLERLEGKIREIAKYWFTEVYTPTVPKPETVIHNPGPAVKEIKKPTMGGKEKTMNVQAIKTLNMDRVLDMDEAVALSADVRAFEAEYEHLGMTIPEWLVKSADVLREEIARRTKADKLARLKNLESQIEGYKSATEKRNEAAKQLAALQDELGMSPAKSGRRA